MSAELRSSGPRARCRCAGIALALLLSLAPQALRADCTVGATGVAFGSYDVFSSTPTDGVGTISIDCELPATFSVALSAGGGNYTLRQLAGPNAALGYNLYTSPSRTVIWGSGAGGTATVGGSGDDVNLNVYGRIPAGQNRPAGSYTDAIIVTVSF